MSTRRFIHTLAGVILIGVLAVASTRAMTASSSSYITISGAVRLPHVTLPAGTYIFELANPHTGRDVVRIYSKDRRKMFAMHLTYGVSRPSTGNMKGTITLGERTAGAPPEVKAWFPEDETVGRAFIYR